MALPRFEESPEQRISRLEDQIEKLKVLLSSMVERSDTQQELLEEHEMQIAVLRAQASGISTQN